jgi:hypothetical protein
VITDTVVAPFPLWREQRVSHPYFGGVELFHQNVEAPVVAEVIAEFDKLSGKQPGISPKVTSSA